MILESADAFMSYLKYIETRKDKNGLLSFGLGDWCHVGRSTPKAPLIVTDTIISMDIANKMAFLFDAVGMTEQYKYAKLQYEQYRKAIRENLINFETMTVHGECQSCQAMGLYYGVFEEEEKDVAFKVLLKMVNDAEEHIDVGVLGGKVIFHVLSDFGYTDLALKMIIRPDYPSYGNWLQRGATTLWENFHPDYVNSPNHHFWGDISAWFIKTLAGINYNPTGLNIKEVDIKPQFATILENAEAYYDSQFGAIKSSWVRNGAKIEVSVQVPEGFKTNLILPSGYFFEDGTSYKEINNETSILLVVKK